MNYKVKVNGKEVKTEQARVSAMPFNRRWPGHQRTLDQTEIIDFLLIDIDEPLDFEITAPDGFENVVIRPKSLGITPEISDGRTIKFTLEKAAYFTVEPYGRQNALHIFADTPKEYDVDINDENVIYFGKGSHDAGMINLKSNQTLFIDEGAVVYACVHAIDAENIKILGKGILDNSRNKEQILFEAHEEGNDSAVNNAVRLHTVQLEYCTDIKIDGITIRDSLVYNIRPVGCENIDIRNVKIIGCWRYNSDGIDMHNCVNVNIENCFLRTFDDSICIKGFDCYYEGDIEKAVHDAMYRNGKSYDVFKNVLVRNCVIWNDWGRCLEIGAETRAEEICDVVFENCDVIHVTSAILDCQNVDYADVHNITYRNINVELDDIIPGGVIQQTDNQKYEIPDPDYCPHLCAVTVTFHHEYSAGGNRRGKNRDILFDNINVCGRHLPKFLFNGYDENHMSSDITVSNVFVNGEPMTDYEIEKNKYTDNIIVI